MKWRQLGGNFWNAEDTGFFILYQQQNIRHRRNFVLASSSKAQKLSGRLSPSSTLIVSSPHYLSRDIVWRIDIFHYLLNNIVWTTEFIWFRLVVLLVYKPPPPLPSRMFFSIRHSVNILFSFTMVLLFMFGTFAFFIIDLDLFCSSIAGPNLLEMSKY